MSIQRYYAQYTDTHGHYQSGWQRTWQVFDRVNTEPGGDASPVCLCINRTRAFTIRDALNAQENAK